MVNLPHQKHPCKDCPYRKDSLKGWLQDSIDGHITASSFVCHKKTDLQCAGHMILNKSQNTYVALAKAIGVDLGLKGQELIFENRQDCIKHHKE